MGARTGVRRRRSGVADHSRQRAVARGASHGRRGRAGAMAATSFALAPRGTAGTSIATLVPGAANVDVAIEVQLTPPPYTHRSTVHLHNPERLEAIEGTVARVTVTNARDVRIRLGARPLTVKPADDRSVVEATLTESGYLAVETGGSDARPGSSLSPSYPIAHRSSVLNGPPATCSCRTRILQLR